MSNSKVGATVPYEQERFQVEQLQAGGKWELLETVDGRGNAAVMFRDVAAGNPSMHLRVQKSSGETVVTTVLPEFKNLDSAELVDGRVVWSGTMAPPKVGDVATARFNSLGEGVVIGYYEEGGYLGVMLSYNLESTPKWFKSQNPNNSPVKAFGAELKPNEVVQ